MFPVSAARARARGGARAPRSRVISCVSAPATCHGPSLMVDPSIEVSTRIIHTQLTHTSHTRHTQITHTSNTRQTHVKHMSNTGHTRKTHDTDTTKARRTKTKVTTKTRQRRDMDTTWTRHAWMTQVRDGRDAGFAHLRAWALASHNDGMCPS